MPRLFYGAAKLYKVKLCSLQNDRSSFFAFIAIWNIPRFITGRYVGVLSVVMIQNFTLILISVINKQLIN